MRSARVKWVEALQFVGTNDANRAIVVDGGSTDEGGGTSVRPKDLVLIGLASCSAVDVVLILKKMRVHFDSLEVVVSAEEADEVPKVFTAIDLEYRVTGSDVPEDKVRRAVELSKEKYCSVSAMLSKAVEITFHHTILPAAD